MDNSANPKHQRSLPLPPPPIEADSPLIPARIVNEWVYCPRLAYLEWVEGEWADSVDTVKGSIAHSQVDRGKGKLPSSEELENVMSKARAVTLSSEKLGVIAKMDVIEIKKGVVMPVDYKKGKRPHVAMGAYEPERVQVCTQAMILEDNGFTVESGALWYIASREKVTVKLDEELRTNTLTAISSLRAMAMSNQRPPPLENSPKCPKCSLAGICLPDETNMFLKDYPPRPLNPSDDPALPLYVQTPGSRVRKDGERLVVESEDDKVEVPILSVSQVALFGPVSITTPTIHALMRQEIPLAWFTTGGWYLGHSAGVANGNIAVREAQFKVAFDEKRRLSFSRELVSAKVQNSRTMLRRNWRGDVDSKTKRDALVRLKSLAKKAKQANSEQILLGIEGEAAAVYFASFPNLLVASEDDRVANFSFQTRNRRPPTDPVNAMLSLAYSMLTRLFSVSISVTGLDPCMGLYHRTRHGRPALALDLMEPFRPIVADSCVIQAINNGEIKVKDFIFNGPACSLQPGGRKSFIGIFERRLEQETTHPVFGYRVSMRRLIEVQVRLLARYLQNEIPVYPHYLPR